MKYGVLVALYIATLLPLAHGQVPRTMLRLPDTGQTKSFTDTYGEDSDFLIHAPFFVVHDDGTVTDTVTGLMWQRSDGGEMSIEAAEDYCESLQLGGYDDWRLPTAQEAFSIFHHGRQNPPMDTLVFQKTAAEYWWTSERQAGNAAKVWVTNAGGGIGNHAKTETLSAGGTKKFHVRAVREVQPLPSLPARYSTTDSSVIDHLTGLEWKRAVSASPMTWEDALFLASNTDPAGGEPWRLPNVKEIESINDEELTQPSLDPIVFPGMGTKRLWTSTSLANQSVRAWFMDTQYGVVSHDLKTTSYYVLLVRGGSGGSTSTKKPVAAVVPRVYPNPFTTVIRLEGAERWTGFQLRDQVGGTVLSGGNISGMDLSVLPAGIYHLILFGKETSSVRLVKL